MTDVVECYSGSAYGERPVAFLWQGQRLQVAEVLERWRTPDGKNFRVRSSAGQLFELFYREHDDTWLIRPV